MISTYTFTGLIAGLLLASTGFALSLGETSTSWIEITRLIHIVVGWLGFVPIALLTIQHRRIRGDHWDGVAAGVVLVIAVLSGLIISLTAALSVAPYEWLSIIHALTTWACVAASLMHIGISVKRRLSFSWVRIMLLPSIIVIGAVSMITVGINFWLQSVTASPDQMDYETAFEDKPFKPANVKLPTPDLIHQSRLSGSAQCGECHQEIYRQWSESMHRFAATDPHVDTGIRWFQRDNGIASGRFCAGCHNPIALLSGGYDRQSTPEEHGTPAHDEGISCLVCHATVGVSEDPLGNGSYIIEAPAVPLIAGGWWARLIIHTDVAAHKAQMMKRPLFQSALFCASCHQQYVPESLGGEGPAATVNQYPEWLESHYANEDSPDFKNCNSCHMPLVEAEDPSAINGKVHSHRFVGANFAHARYAGLEEQERLTLELIKSAVSMTASVAKEQFKAKHATIEVTVSNTGAGHRFPSGTTDIGEAWLEVLAGNPKSPQYSSGLLDKDHYLDPKAHSWRTVYVDSANLPVDLHNLAAVRKTILDTYIEPGKSDVARFEIPISGPEAINVRIRLRLRKANQRWTDWLTNFDGHTEAVANIHETTLTIEPGGLNWSRAPKAAAIPAPKPVTAQFPSMVLIPAGPAVIGSDSGDSDETPVQHLKLGAFFIDRLPVTNSQYRRFLRAAKKPGPVHRIDWAKKYNWTGQEYPPGTADQPAILISREEAMSYCAWRGKRLPREVEWEKAARGPTGLIYPWGNKWEDGACEALDGVEVPPQVGLCPNRASPYGIHEMVGGVYEWTADPYMAYSRSTLHRNANEWITVFGDPAYAIRGVPSGQVGPATTAASRSGHADNMRARIGFRCAQDAYKRKVQ